MFIQCFLPLRVVESESTVRRTDEQTDRQMSTARVRSNRVKCTLKKHHNASGQLVSAGPAKRASRPSAAAKGEAVGRGKGEEGKRDGRERDGEGSVSYTHLTLPTKRIV